MARYSSYSNNTPITTWNNFPIYLTTILTGCFALGLLFSLLAGGGVTVALFADPTPLHPLWSVWRLFTYIFVDRVSYFTLFYIAFFYWACIGIETHLGRPVLVRLLAILVLMNPLVSLLWYWIAGAISMNIGAYTFLAGLITAFATLYPNSEGWFNLPFKWIALASVFLGVIILVRDGEMIELTQLLACCAAGFAFINHAKEMEYDDAIPLATRIKNLFPRKKAKFRVLPDPDPAPSRRPVVESAEDAEMDALLDKIAKHGMASLTGKERSRLEKGREALLKKDKRDL